MTEAPDYWYVTPLVGTVAAIVAGWAVRTNRTIARTKATIDLIERTESSPHYQDLYNKFDQLFTENKNEWRSIKAPSTAECWEDRRKILGYLNHYELVALGIETGILDEGLYIKWMRTQLVSDWTNAKEFVTFLRLENRNTSTSAAYIQLERLARRFENNKERELRINRYKGKFKELISIIRESPRIFRADKRKPIKVSMLMVTLLIFFPIIIIESLRIISCHHF